jgi:preprotein translocase subunit YajC
MSDVLLVVVLALPLIGLWLLIRGSQRRTQAAADLAAGLRVGNDVITTSGLYGSVAALDDQTVTLLVAPGVEVRYDRRAVARILDDQAPPGGDEAGPVA